MNKCSLLLVDDDRQVLESMADWLRDQGYQLDVASSYATALAAVSKKNYDLLLLDIRLRDGDGFDLLAHCREHQPGLCARAPSICSPSR
jgi:DNA-binding response OmpR family regulator